MMLKSLKQKIAKVGIGLFCAGCVFLSSAAYSQAASYTAYALKLNKTNNFTSMHAKTTSDDYITNEVTAITNTSSQISGLSITARVKYLISISRVLEQDLVI